jgi:DNA-binding response OmpR family regulator
MAAASVVLLTDDLMFGSKVEAMIRAAGAEPVLAATPPDALAAIEQSGARLLIVDLVSDGFDGTALAAAAGVATLGYYAHTDDDTRRAALAAGFDKLVPRSRMVREGDTLIASILSGG